MQKNKGNKLARKQKRATKSVTAVTTIPAAMVARTRNNPAKMSSNNGSITVSHREYMADVSPTTGYTVVGFSINPGLFPWLSGLSKLYESYTFKKLVFEYRPSVGTSRDGSIAMAVDYDATELPAENKAEFMSAKNAVKGPVWSPLRYVCQKVDLEKFSSDRYSRAIDVAGDRRFTDIGNLFVSAQSDRVDVVGDLYVDYTVVLKTPEPYNEVAADEGARIVANTGVSKSLPLGTAPEVVQGKSSRIRVDSMNSRIYFDRAGEYLMDVGYNGTTIPIDSRVSLNSVPVGRIEADAKSWLTGLESVASIGEYIVKVIAPGGYLNLALPAAVTSANLLWLRIAPYRRALQ